MDIDAVRKEIEKDLSWIEDSEFTYRRRDIDDLTEVTVYDREAAVVAGTYVVSINLHAVTPGQ